MPAGYDLICMRNHTGGCGFRAHDRYFEEKKRFRAGVCPNCNGPVAVVEAGTDTVDPKKKVDPVSGRVS